MAAAGFCNVTVTLDGMQVGTRVYTAGERPQFAGTDGALRLEYDFTSDGCAHELRCCAEGVDGFVTDSGENYEAVTADIGRGRMTIGCEGDFSDISAYDFGGCALPDGICINIYPETQSRRFVFGVCWLMECTDDDVRTWYGADPTLDR